MNRILIHSAFLLVLLDVYKRQEADSYYDKSVHTGIQAYNKGMQEIYKYAAGRIYVNLSIAPIFPAQDAQSRRISCDSWGDINNTKCVLNCLSYGWWLDHVYQ